MPEQKFTIPNDPTNGRINERIIVRMKDIADQFTELSNDAKQEFNDTLLRTGLKLIAVWSHLNKYKEIEDQLIAIAEARGAITEAEKQQLEYSLQLFTEIDEFLVQLKSTLDYLVKIPIPILGKNRWPLRTFSDKGENVANALVRNIPKSHLPRAQSIKEELIDRYNPWLTDVINMRDATNHFIDGGFDYQKLMVFKQTVDGEDKLHVPMWDDKLTVRIVLETSWISLMKFVEDFVALFLSLKIVPQLGMIHDVVDHESNQSPWRVATIEEVERERTAPRPEQRILTPKVKLYQAIRKPKRRVK